MRSYNLEALVLRSRPMREADRLITVYSKEQGKKTLVAYGASKSSSRKRGAVQPLCHSRFLVNRGKGLDVVNQCESLTVLTGLRNSLEKLTWAFYLCELVEAMTEEDEVNQPIFILLLTILHWLNQDQIDLEAGEKLVCGFEIKLLGLLGYLPELNFCVHCGKNLNQPQFFSFRDGGLLCQQCAGLDNMGMKIKTATSVFLQQLIITKPGALPSLSPDKRIMNETKALLRRFIVYHGEKQVKSLEFLASLHKINH